MSYSEFAFSGNSTTANQISRLISMVDATAKKSLIGVVTDRAKKRTCLCCDKPAVKRGLCKKHYSHFRRLLLSEPCKDRAKFEAKQIKEGKILAQGQIREIISAENNPFVMD